MADRQIVLLTTGKNECRVLEALNGNTVHADDEVAFGQTRFRGARSGGDTTDDQPLLNPRHRKVETIEASHGANQGGSCHHDDKHRNDVQDQAPSQHRPSIGKPVKRRNAGYRSPPVIS